ncbi:MAG: hypothetical protein SynsKO_31320 [Synoicihabitans sp.]
MLAIVAGTGWRAAHLENRPLHADEAVQAWQTWRLLDGKGYEYDPWDRHGPSLYFGSAALHRLRGGDAADYDDREARRFPFAVGIATLILIGVGARLAGFGQATGTLAALLLVFETFTSLYHTYFVQEATLAFLVWAFVFLCLKSEVRRPLLHFGLIGALVGLAQATKATTPLYFGFAAIALWMTRESKESPVQWRFLGAAVCGFLIPYIALYSSFGIHPAGLWDGIKTYFLQAERLAESPHSYPWWHHLRNLGLVPSGGPRWGQYLLLALGLAGGIQAFLQGSSRAQRVTALLTFSLLVFHSIISYKTPWLLLTPVVGLVLLAAEFLNRLLRWPKFGIAAVTVLVPLTMIQSHAKSSLALSRYPGDIRNPYFYEQAPRGLARLPARIDQLQAAQKRPLRVAVVSPEHAWPLPWYLREAPQVGYFDSASVDLSQWDMVIWDDQLGEPPDSLMEYAMGEIYSLRPNVMLYVYISGPVWEKVFPPISPD